MNLGREIRELTVEPVEWPQPACEPVKETPVGVPEPEEVEAR